MSSFRYAITIEGIPLAFAEPDFPPAQLASWASVLYTLHSISEGEQTLDLGARRQIGSGFQWGMRDVGTTLQTLCVPRADKVAWLTTASIPATATTIASIAVSSEADIPTTFYMGAETLAYDTSSTGTLTTVLRSLYGSQNRKLYGSAEDGASTAIYAQPKRWTGRRVTLWESIQDQAGTFGAKAAIATTTMEDAPQPIGADEWEFQAASLSQWYASRPIFQGFQGVVPPTDASGIGSFGSTVTLEADDVKRLWNGQNHEAAFVFWTQGEDLFWTSPVDNATATTIDLATSALPYNIFVKYAVLNRENALSALAQGRSEWTEAKPALVFTGDPVDLTLALLTSHLGDEVLGIHDVLPGYDSDEFGGIQYSAGAKIDGADIDLPSFYEFAGDGPGWMVVLDEPTSVDEILKEFCQAVGAFWFVNSAGQITVERLQERIPISQSVVTIDDSLLILESSDGAGVTEASVHHSVRFSANWDPLEQRHETTITVVDAPAKEEAPFDDSVLQLESKFVGVDVDNWKKQDLSLQRVNPLSRDILETSLRRVQQYSKTAGVEKVMVVPVTTATRLAIPGSHLRVTNARTPNLKGGTMVDEIGLVIGRARDYERGTFTIRVRIFEAGFVFAPAVEVTGVSAVGGAVYDLTLSSATKFGPASSPSSEFAAGWDVENTLGTWTASSIALQSSTVIRVTRSGANPVVGDIVIPTYATGKATNGDDIAPDDCLYGVNANGTSSVLTRWN